jgi:sugar/nucleoside kinase (ribokinase family)
VLFRRRNALTTRGWNGYGENEHRAFKYLTEKKRLTADDLTPELLQAKSIHLICSPTRCVDLVKRIHERREELLGRNEHEHASVRFIWEPVPDMCIEAELEKTLEALSYVDIISPNHEELGSLFGYAHKSGVDIAALESHTSKLTAHGIGPTGKGAVVIRVGKEGCYIARSGSKAGSWLPPYHRDQSKVIDPTGGGNGFLGGLAVGLVRTDFDVVKAAAWGGVAASLCIEQVGVPRLTAGNDGRELWNDVDVQNRLEAYQARLA